MDFDRADPEQHAIGTLRQTNLERIQALAQHGVQVNVNRPNKVLEFLLDHVVGTDTPARLEFERNDAQGIADDLDAIEAEVRKQQLSAGVAVDPRVLQQIQQR